MWGSKSAVKEVPYDGHEYLTGHREPAVRANEVATETPSEENKIPQTVTSRIRVLLSRRLTWAEKEDLETDQTDWHMRRTNQVSKLTGDSFRVWVDNDFEHVWLEGEMGSRLLFDLIVDRLANGYVNVFPKAVRTYREYNGN